MTGRTRVVSLLLAFSIALLTAGDAAAASEEDRIVDSLRIPMPNGTLPRYSDAQIARLKQMVDRLKSDPSHILAVIASYSDLRWRGVSPKMSWALDGGIAQNRSGEVVRKLLDLGLPQNELGRRVWSVPIRAQTEAGEPFVDVVLVERADLRNWITQQIAEVLIARRDRPGESSLVIPVSGEELRAASDEEREILAEWTSAANADPSSRVLIWAATPEAARAAEALLRKQGLRSDPIVVPFQAAASPEKVPVTVSLARGVGGADVVRSAPWPAPDAFVRLERDGAPAARDLPALRKLLRGLGEDPEGGVIVYEASPKGRPLSRQEVEQLLLGAGLSPADLGRVRIQTLPPVEPGASPRLELYRTTRLPPRAEGDAPESLPLPPDGPASSRRWIDDLQFVGGVSVSWNGGWDEHRTAGLDDTGPIPTLDFGVRWNPEARATWPKQIDFVCKAQLPGSLFENGGGSPRLSEYELLVNVYGPLCAAVSYQDYLARHKVRRASRPEDDIVFTEKQAGWGAKAYLRFGGFDLGMGILRVDRTYTLEPRWTIRENGDTQLTLVAAWRFAVPRRRR